MSTFQKYQKLAYPQMEKRILEKWQKETTFQKSVQRRSVDKKYVFYDGPPFITGLPHHGTLLSSIVKDVVPRYKTMSGYHVQRRWGWDCHGLPAENLVENKLQLKDKKAVLAYGLENYIRACRQNMIQTGSLWQESIERIGRWVSLRTLTKLWMLLTWSQFGGFLSNSMKRAIFMKVKKFFFIVCVVQHQFLKPKSPWIILTRRLSMKVFMSNSL